MTNYQEQITQMQHDLETGLETMAELLGNTGGDTAGIINVNNLQHRSLCPSVQCSTSLIFCLLRSYVTFFDEIEHYRVFCL